MKKLLLKNKETKKIMSVYRMYRGNSPVVLTISEFNGLEDGDVIIASDRYHYEKRDFSLLSTKK